MSCTNQHQCPCSQRGWASMLIATTIVGFAIVGFRNEADKILSLLLEKISPSKEEKPAPGLPATPTHHTMPRANPGSSARTAVTNEPPVSLGAPYGVAENVYGSNVRIIPGCGDGLPTSGKLSHYSKEGSFQGQVAITAAHDGTVYVRCRPGTVKPGHIFTLPCITSPRIGVAER